MSANDTPMMAQYKNIKSQHQDEILFFRLGDFYEMFFTDAEIASRELEITLTSREGGQNMRIPMCGVPYHAAENYIARLINKGFKVAICEQVEDPKQTKGIVRREVIKVITPGTVLSETLLPDQSNNYLTVIAERGTTLCLAAADISTGECLWVGYEGINRLPALCDQLYRLMPAELVIAGEIANDGELKAFINSRLANCAVSNFKEFDAEAITGLPGRHFAAEELPDCQCAQLSLGILLFYLHQTLKNDLSHLNRLTHLNFADSLVLDTSTLRNLEVTRNMRDGGKKETLLGVLDYTSTAMGGRLLKNWLEYPLMHAGRIMERQDAIAELLDQPAERQLVKTALSAVYDFERILTRVEVGTANARDLIALKDSLAVIPALQNSLANFRTALLTQLGTALTDHSSIVRLIDAAITETPPISLRDGGLIKENYHAELDELRSIARDSREWIQSLEARERERTGIKSLKIGYNKVFGYYLEVTHSNSSAVPVNYVRKQTLANAERYITPELKDFETKVLGAQEKIVSLEYVLFSEIRDSIKSDIRQIQQTARQIALLDTLVSLSEAAERYNYARPQIRTNGAILIKDGRHPVVERLLQRELFVPNDTLLDHHENEVMVITGPNMAGKSTYMRQVALLVLMAQTGSFIPAREAVISPVDRIFTRVGASDDLSTGQSTFMVEMNEVAQILKYATAKSLIVLDEIGRGTSTFDGMSIARAVIEYINERIKAKTLFATHYHELTELADYGRNIKNYSVAVKERGRDVVFLRRIVPGGADKSYGIHVAQLAGLPKKLIDRASRILAELEQNHPPAVRQPQVEQTAATLSSSLFESALAADLLAIDVLSITPLEALNILYRLQTEARKESGQL
ncbi:DNA mismatch repair protein MutS|uniref:DNA mismatch repair protein MutS n=1 Tax=Dendrosporobacter quercicolus TaxID=146817 RepID=A0A1G9LQP4_9FIRM|nr:DNA mismatch repair protein MutS [Dendrosporobacter quercicolus]NSL46795.1 DNA mismatch repair protein MutS [Dendrosporobacter quercicolus DSM 1736]SDL64124.1 DNA mismatch repair protein MutS [Dendrosporobacter quercicolus]